MKDDTASIEEHERVFSVFCTTLAFYTVLLSRHWLLDAPWLPLSLHLFAVRVTGVTGVTWQAVQQDRSKLP